jgi:hypothetical protein
MSYSDYIMPFGWGEFEENEKQEEKPSTRQKVIHPITRLALFEQYIPVDALDRQRATAQATRLRKRGIIDVKYANGMFTRVK